MTSNININNNNNNNTTEISHDAPLRLAALRDCLSEDTYEWLEDAEQKEVAWQKIQKSLQAFQQQANAKAAPACTTEELSSSSISDGPLIATTRRVLEWTSSVESPDGYGGFEVPTNSIDDDDDQHPPEQIVGETTGAPGLVVEEEEHANTSNKNAPIRVQYILSDNWQGFGNQVWASSRHLANLLADKSKCRLLLGPSPLHSLLPEVLRVRGVAAARRSPRRHPLRGMRFCELGTGAGIPSWMALRCGARVVALDQAIPGRIRVIAECAERNWREMKATTTTTTLLANIGDNHNEDEQGMIRPMVCPYDWGNPVDGILAMLASDAGAGPDDVHDAMLGPQKRFDVLVAADCCFMPWFHAELLDSIDMLLSDRGVAILTFALHGNVPDEQIWGIVELAQEKGFATDQPVPPEQLTPQLTDMNPKQALVYTLRLTKQIA